MKFQAGIRAETVPQCLSLYIKIPEVTKHAAMSAPCQAALKLLWCVCRAHSFCREKKHSSKNLADYVICFMLNKYSGRIQALTDTTGQLEPLNKNGRTQPLSLIIQKSKLLRIVF